MEDIYKATKQYAIQVLIVANMLLLLAYSVQYFAGLSPTLLAPMAISYGFYLITAGIFSLVWKRVAISNPDMLTTVYMATSGFRMLLALATLTIVYIIVGREQMMSYAVVFMIFYLVAVGHHSYFFARFNNKK